MFGAKIIGMPRGRTNSMEAVNVRQTPRGSCEAERAHDRQMPLHRKGEQDRADTRIGRQPWTLDDEQCTRIACTHTGNLVKQAHILETLQKVGHRLAFHNDGVIHEIITDRHARDAIRNVQGVQFGTDTGSTFAVINNNHGALLW